MGWCHGVHPILNDSQPIMGYQIQGIAYRLLSEQSAFHHQSKFIKGISSQQIVIKLLVIIINY